MTRTRKPSDFKKLIINELKNIKYQSPIETFHDFVKAAAYSVSNCVDKLHFDRREKLYMDISRRLGDDMVIISKAFSYFVMLMETNEYNDHLGSIFEELGANRADLGQFFTPYSASKLLTQLVLTDEDIQKNIQEKGFVTLNEPTCGSSGMVIAFAERLLSLGYNPQKHLLALCQDIDDKAVAMSYLQLSLYNIPAVVVQCDVLKLDNKDIWYTPAFVHRLALGDFASSQKLSAEKDTLMARIQRLVA